MKTRSSRTLLRIIYTLLLAVCVVAFKPSAARADRGDISLGVITSLGKPQVGLAVRSHVGGVARVGLSDWLALEAALGPRYEEGLGLEGALGMVLMADIFQWVPELAISGVCDLGPDSSGEYVFSKGVRGELRARYFLSMRSTLTVGGGVIWLDSQLMPSASLGLLFLLD